MKTSPVYRHYNNPTYKFGVSLPYFSAEEFTSVTNRLTPWNKPESGGLWLSKIGTMYGWYDWCKDNMPKWINNATYFDVKLCENANIIYFKCEEDLWRLAKSHPDWFLESLVPWYTFDFERMVHDGVDAIDVDIMNGLYDPLYGWDCNSVLVMNKDVVVKL